MSPTDKVVIRRRTYGVLIPYVILMAGSVFAVFPIFWMVSVSVRHNVDIFKIPVAWLPTEFTLSAYRQIVSTPHYIRVFANTYFVAAAVTAISLILATLAGYSFSRFDFRGNRIIQFFVIGTQMVPPISLVIPYFFLITTLKLYDSYLGLILTYTAFVLPFSTLMMISYFNTIPQDLEEAAMVDGCTRVGALIRVVLPLVVPALIGTGVYAFLLAWNEFLFALTLTQHPDMQMVTVAIALLSGEQAFQWNVLMGFSVLGCIPLLITFLFFQKYLMAGLTVGAVKG